MTVNLKDVGSGFKRTAINENFTTIESTLNSDVLLKDGSQQLEANLDFNSNRGINLTEGVLNSDAATVGQINSLATGLNSGSIATLREVQAGSDLVASVTTLVDIVYVVGTNNLYVFRNGNFQTKGVDYSETTASSVTWLSPINSTDSLVFMTNASTTSSVTSTAAISHVDNGVVVNLASWLQAPSRTVETQLGSAATGQVFTLATAYELGDNSLEVRRNGLPQVAASYTETSSTSVTVVGSFNATDTFEFIVYTGY
jgi:hypothetical protein